MTVNIVGAEEWRRNTIRMFNDIRSTRSYNESVVLRSVQHRNSIAKLLAQGFLSDSHPVHPLLRSLIDPNTIKERLDDLIELFDQIAVLAIWAGTEERGLLLTPINRLPPHDDDGPLTVSHWFSQSAEKEVCLTGRYPVLMTRPLIHRLTMDKESGIREFLACAAEVVVSKPLGPEEIEGFQDDSCENWDIPTHPAISKTFRGEGRAFKGPPRNIKFPPEN